MALLLLFWCGWSLWSELEDCGRLCVVSTPDGVELGDIHPVGGLFFIMATGWHALTGQHPVVLRINSGGGDFPTGRLMAGWTRFIDRRAGVRAEVAANDRCGSSCTLIWAAASERLADRNAVFFFHAVRWASIDAQRWRFVGLGGQTQVMADTVAAIDPRLAAYLDVHGAYRGAAHDVTLLGSDIAALGGDYVTLRHLPNGATRPAPAAS